MIPNVFFLLIMFFKIGEKKINSIKHSKNENKKISIPVCLCKFG